MKQMEVQVETTATTAEESQEGNAELKRQLEDLTNKVSALCIYSACYSYVIFSIE